MSSNDANGQMPIKPRTVVDDLSALVREVLTFGTTVGTSAAQLDDHRATLDNLRSLLDQLIAEQKRANDLKEAEERRLEARGGRDHEFRMRLLHGAGGLLTGCIVPALLWYFTGWSPNQNNTPPVKEVRDEQSP